MLEVSGGTELELELVAVQLQGTRVYPHWLNQQNLFEIMLLGLLLKLRFLGPWTGQQRSLFYFLDHFFLQELETQIKVFIGFSPFWFWDFLAFVFYHIDSEDFLLIEPVCLGVSAYRFDVYEGLEKVFGLSIGPDSFVELDKFVVIEKCFWVLGERVKLRICPETFIDSIDFIYSFFLEFDDSALRLCFYLSLLCLAVDFVVVFEHKHRDSFFKVCVDLAFLWLFLLVGVHWVFLDNLWTLFFIFNQLIDFLWNLLFNRYSLSIQSLHFEVFFELVPDFLAFQSLDIKRNKFNDMIVYFFPYGRV